MAEVTTIHTDTAPKAVGPYSQAVVHDGVAYLSGQIGLDPESGRLVAGGIEAQARQVMRNLAAVLAAAGGELSDILKVNIYLVDMADFPILNAIYADWLGAHRPARATVAVAALPLGACIEMDVVARIRV